MGGGGGGIKNDEQISNTTNRKALLHVSPLTKDDVSAQELLKNSTHVAVKYSYSLQHVQCMCTSRGL